MDHETIEPEPRLNGLFGRTSSAGSSLRRSSLSLSSAAALEIDDYIDTETVSEAGDIGDRALQSKRNSENGSLPLSFDNALENGVELPSPENKLLQSYGFWSRDPAAVNAISPVTPLPEEIAYAPSSKGQSKGKVIPQSLEYISCLIHLAAFGILGVLTRYLLQKLFGPSVAGVMSDQGILYLDLPSNMVGSFLMGWLGVVFKEDICRMSDLLAIGLTTGYLGSLTTFSGWNLKMLELSADGKWLLSVLGFLIGLFLAAYSISFGVETAKGFRWLLHRLPKSLLKDTCKSGSNWRVDSCRRHLIVMVVMLLMVGVLLSVSALQLKEEFSSGSSKAHLWLGCIVGPLGVWIRWFLAPLNGRGLGKERLLKWFPFETLLANALAACVMAALATLKKAVNTETCHTLATGIQLGFLGCLSTVSTFIAEFNAMRESKYPWRAYIYALNTIGISFGFGVLIYNLPLWILEYEKNMLKPALLHQSLLMTS